MSLMSNQPGLSPRGGFLAAGLVVLLAATAVVMLGLTTIAM